MTCHYHPGSPLLRTIERIPAFVAQEVDATERTVLRCGVVGCPFVAQEEDAERVDIRRCNRCRARLGDRYSLSDNRCDNCRNNHGRKRSGAAWRGARGEIKHAAAGR